MPLSDHLTLAQPLGPPNQSLVKEPRDAAELLDGAAPFLDALADNATIVLGRRGSGKSSVLHGYRAELRYGRSFGRFNNPAIPGRDVVMPFLNWQDFHLMARSVGRELSAMLKENPDPDFLFAETISEIWQYFIWEAIFTTINVGRSEGKLTNDETNALGAVFDFFNLSSIASTDLSSVASQQLITKAQKGLSDYLLARNKTCHVLFDNLDEYPIRNPLIEGVIAGFLHAVHAINENFPKIHILVCIPEELQSFLQTKVANIEKAFTSTHRMRWKPIDLLQIVAYRYRCFMEIHDEEFHKSIEKLNLADRKDIISLFARILPPTVENALGYPEPTLSYIIRHTQLLPRHFIILFNSMLLKAHVHTGGFRLVDENSVISGIAEGEKYVAAQILKPFEEIYPRFIKVARMLLGNLPPICGERDLDKVHARFKERVEEDLVDVWSTLHEIGVLGMLDSDDVEHIQNSNEMYLYAKWSYNSDVAFAKTARQHYCIHPIFSKFYGLVRRKDSIAKALYPEDVELIS
jgi:hypothetical protein